MRRRRCARAMIMLAVGWAVGPALAGVTLTGDTKDDGSYLTVGTAKGTGAMLIDSGSVLSRSGTIIGEWSGSAGSVVVTGAGSTLTNSNYVYVGLGGSGTLTIQAGGEVSSVGCSLGFDSGATGSAIVTGPGSKRTNSFTLFVGDSGNGTLTVSDGGSVSAPTLFASLSDLHGNGTITVQRGAVLDANLVFDATHGTTQALAFGSGGTLQLTADGTGVLGAGYKHSGSLRISDGRSVTSSNGYVGYSPGSNGMAIVTGAGSQWITSGSLSVWSGTLTVSDGGLVSARSLYVGGHGSGTLMVSDGGLVNAKTLYASLGDLRGNGSINASGAVLDNDLVFDAGHGTTQPLAFGSGGTLQLTVDGTGALGAGHQRSGSLRIAEGRSVTSVGGYLGYNAGSTGTAVVTGAESKWTDSGDIYVGYSGSGTLKVEAGGQVSNSNRNFNPKSYIGSNAGSSGNVIVSGAGSKWTTSGDLTVGWFGSGVLRVEDGGQVSDVTSYIASTSGSSGKVVVTGTGSKWQCRSARPLRN